jgi:anti-sigma factor RsiW
MSFLHRRRFARDHRFTPPRLSAYLDGDLGSRARARIARHVDACPECRGLLRSLGRLVLALGAPPAPEPVAERLLAGLRETLDRADPR